MYKTLKGGTPMRITQMSIVVTGTNSEQVSKVLNVLNHFEATTSLPYFNRDEVSQIHRNNKNAAFCLPFDMVEDLSSGTIVINVGESDPDRDFFDNVVIVDENDDSSLISQLQVIADKYDIDLGDYIEEHGLVKKQQNTDDCLLCRLYRDGTRYREVYGPYDPREVKKISLMNTILFESKNFYVIPAKGALVEGYVMIVPKGHYLSFAALPPELLKEALQVLQDIKSIFAHIFGDEFVVFEHGTGAQGSKHEKSIVHAHLHVVPFSMVMTPETRKAYHLTPIDIRNLSTYSKVPYLLYTDSETNWCISADPDVYIPRQCVRQLIGDGLGLDGTLWNWRHHNFMCKITDTVNHYYNYLRKNYLTLPENISKGVSDFMHEMNLRKNS